MYLPASKSSHSYVPFSPQNIKASSLFCCGQDMFGIEPGKPIENNVIFSLFCIWSLSVQRPFILYLVLSELYIKWVSVLEGIASERNILYESLSLGPLYSHEWEHYRNPFHSVSKSRCSWINCRRRSGIIQFNKRASALSFQANLGNGFPAWSDSSRRTWGTLHQWPF